MGREKFAQSPKGPINDYISTMEDRREKRACKGDNCIISFPGETRNLVCACGQNKHMCVFTRTQDFPSFYAVLC